MKFNAKLFFLFILLMTPLVSQAVTDKEMEHARAIAAKAYLRYANDLSGYLDAVHPATMAELEHALKPKEKENLKAFKALAVPTDYQAWDRAKLEEYWGTTVFKSKGLLEKGRAGKIGAKRDLKKMAVSEAPTTPASNVAQSVEKVPDPVQQAVPATDTLASEVGSLEESIAAIDEMEEDSEIEKASNHTWIYIVILCLLIGVVVALVVFASNVMKKNADHTGSVGEGGVAASELNRKLQSKGRSLEAVQAELKSLEEENARLKARISELLASGQFAERVSPSKTYDNVREPDYPRACQPKQEDNLKYQPKQEPDRRIVSDRRTVFLGKVNPRNIFVRADRSPMPGHTVFQLETSDGLTGTFRVASDATVWRMALENPYEILSGGCNVADIMSASDKNAVVTDQAGTAIFEGGCWKVLRKARVHFE